jgi:hypothetical protein
MQPDLPTAQSETVVIPSSEAQPSSQGRKKIIILGVGASVIIIIIGAVFFILSGQKKPSLPPVKEEPVKQENAGFSLTAEPLEATVTGQVKVSVWARSPIDNANLFVAKLKFPTTLLQAKNISLAKAESSSSGFIKNWFVSNWVENSIDNNAGSVSLVGGVPNPGVKTPAESSGSAMAEVLFQAKAAGKAEITFDDTSAIYRNSDNVNILTTKLGVTVDIVGSVPVEASATPTLSVTPNPTKAPVSLEFDLNDDGKVNAQDISILLSLWGTNSSELPKADFNKDGLINTFDYAKLIRNLAN